MIGAYVYGLQSEKGGIKKSLVQSLILMIIAVIGMMFMPNKLGFFIVGALAGYAMAGVQMLSRTMVSVFAPEGKSAEFYGFLLAGRTHFIHHRSRRDGCGSDRPFRLGNVRHWSRLMLRLQATKTRC